MARLGITEAFARYGAVLRNPQWSVSAWAPDGTLVVSLWDHHYRKGPAGTMEFSGSLDRWSGPGNSEFRKNVAQAYQEGKNVRLVIVKTAEIARVEAGEDASKIKKEFFIRDDVVGSVIALTDDEFVILFNRA